jgi:hypothetical protein
MGFHDVWQYHYAPAYHETVTVAEVLINKDIWDSMPEDLQEIVKLVSREHHMWWEQHQQMNRRLAMDEMVGLGVEFRRTPQDILDESLDATTKGALSVVLTLRGDFFGHLLSYRPLADDLAGSFQSFLDALAAIAAEANGGEAVSLLLLQIGQVSLAGARLGAQRDFTPIEEYQRDVGPDADLDDTRMRLAEILGNVDTYSYVHDPYEPEVLESRLSDDLTAIAADLENGMRHYRVGDVDEAMWWWQFSYVNNWGALAGATMKALLSVVSHDRLDVEIIGEAEQIEAAEAVLDATVEEG